ncbi:MAG: ribosome-associated translation inhibitor RaiA [Candidatus Moranbacteria bacterium]|nr:ribosome-associated translation inhibitor RaiA [Candidatus Moranbacteria bacterium]
MNIRFFFKEVKIDERTKSYVTEKVEKLEKFFQSFHEDAEISAEVEIDLDKKGKFRVEVMLHTPYQDYRGEDTTISIEGSIDSVYEELENQIQKDKNRIITLQRRGGRSLKKKMVIDENARF